MPLFQSKNQANLLTGPAFLATSGTLAFLLLGFALPALQARVEQGSSKAPPRKSGKATTAPAGQRLFKEQCAPCHGEKGEGSEAYSRALTGKLSVKQLATYIAKSMPPGPKKIPAADAAKVASYIHDAFYSPVAQERNRPARVALSHLTVRQMRYALTDLLASFRPGPGENQAGGLKAEYYKARHFDEKQRVLERVDPEVRFEFGQEGPVPDKFDPHQFSIRWSGSVVAPDTGVYEFIVRTEHAARLWLNDDEKALIDAWVKSGNDNEYRASLFLIGGRRYPLYLEFSKSTQGVDDSDKKKGKPAPPASVSLSWKRPKQPEETIPARCLVPHWSPESYIPTAPFPPDDRSMGYERGNAVSRAWDDATTTAALETADYVAAHLKELAGTTDDPAKLRDFCGKFVERALRRPLSTEIQTRYISRQFDTAPDLKTAVKRVVLLSLKSPYFLYREPGASGKDPYAVAARLSFALWDTLPDQALLQAAASGQLTTREQVQRQAERMVADPRAWNKQRDFFLTWLKVDHYPDLAKDNKRFPEFTPPVAADLRTSLDLTLSALVNSERSDFRELLLSDKVYLNGRLAKLYGASLPEDAPFQPVSLEPQLRAGVLTHPYLLASFAYIGTSSPIHRGVLLARNILGRTLQPPPAAFAPLAPDLHPNLTTRERVTLQTRPANCMSCHGLINPLGFSLERFDAIGRARSSENGKPINATGSYEPQGGKPVKFNGARELARYAADSPEVHSAFVEKLFQYMIKQPIRAYGSRAQSELEKAFKENNYNIRRLVVEIATEAALQGKK